MISIFQDKKEKEGDESQSDIEKLVNYLAALLEYDESYFSCLQTYKLQRSTSIHLSFARVPRAQA
jgi:hypothetical protein